MHDRNRQSDSTAAVVAAASKRERKAATLEALASGRPMKYGDLRKIAGSNVPIRELVEEGRIEKLPLGLYALPARDTSWDMLSALSVRFPSAVICLASAAAYHGLTAQNPHEVWAAFPYSSSVPRSSDVSVRGFRWKGAAMEAGVETVEIGGVPVRITSPARTVADFLRTMNRTGETELAMEALGNYTGRMADIVKAARQLGAEKAVTPFTQAAMGIGRRR